MGVYQSLEYWLCYDKEKKEYKKQLLLLKVSQQLSTENVDNNITETAGLLMDDNTSESREYSDLDNSRESIEMAEMLIERHTASSVSSDNHNFSFQPGHNSSDDGVPLMSNGR